MIISRRYNSYGRETDYRPRRGEQNRSKGDTCKYVNDEHVNYRGTARGKCKLCSGEDKFNRAAFLYANVAAALVFVELAREVKFNVFARSGRNKPFASDVAFGGLP